LAYLLLNRTAPVSREYLAFLLWPDDEETTARTKLRATISDLLKALPQPASDLIEVDTERLQWNPAAPVWLDVDEFEAAARDPARAREAIELYRGDLLPELYEDWLDALRERHRNAYLRCLTDLVSAERRAGALPQAIDTARTLLTIDPWREDIVRRIMAMRYELGDGAGALNEYVRFSARLREEMGIDPMLETVALAEQIGAGHALPDEADAAAGTLLPGLTRDERAPLFGRRRELERLTEVWSRAKRGRGSIVFMGGEPGIGKSRLALEFVHRVEDDGGRVLAGATGIPESFPYQAFVEALRAGLPLVAALGLGPTWFAALAALVPELQQRVGPLPPLPAIDGEQRRLRVYEALSRALVGLAKPRPLLLLLEDLHWASQSTFDALAFVARQTAGSPVLILGTFRDDEAHRRHPLRRLQREAEFAGTATTVSLPPLDLEAVDAIVHRAAHAGAAAPDVAALHARSGGNPLFLAQLLAAPAGVLSEKIPPTLASLIGARLDAMPERARTFVEIAALVGERFAVEIVRDVAGWDDATALAATDDLLDRRIVREVTGRGIFRYAFAHQLVQQAVLDATDAHGLRERSRRIARVLSELYPERADELAGDVARHLEQSGDAAAAAERYLVAARRSFDVGAVDESLRSAVRGLALTSERGARRQFLLLRDAIHERRADVAAQAEDIEALSALAEQDDDDDLRCTVLLRRFRMAVREGRGEALVPLRDLRALASRSGDLRRQADADFAESQLFDLNLSADECVRLARSALEKYERIGDRAGSANAMAAMAGALSARGDQAEAQTYSERAIALAEESGDYDARVRTLRLANGVALDARSHARVSNLGRRWLDLTLTAGDRREEAVALTQVAWPLLESARFMEAVEPLQRAAVVAGQWNLTRVRAMVESNLAEVWIKLGAFDAARRALETSSGAFGPNAAAHAAGAQATLGLVLALQGERERASEVVEDALRVLRDIGKALQIPMALECAAEAARGSDRTGLAREYMEAAFAARGKSRLPLSMAKDAAFLAALNAESGALDAAREWLTRIPNASDAPRGHDYWPQRTAWAAAFAAHVCGDGEAATAWLTTALRAYETYRQHLDAEQRETFAALSWHRNMLAARDGVWSERAW
jgi:DNA-binding SARP family transcriptional activator